MIFFSSSLFFFLRPASLLASLASRFLAFRRAPVIKNVGCLGSNVVPSDILWSARRVRRGGEAGEGKREGDETALGARGLSLSILLPPSHSLTHARLAVLLILFLSLDLQIACRTLRGSPARR